MTERRTTCLRCHTYDLESARCRVGKSNPRKKHEAQTVAELLGVQSICLHNPFREPLILRMRFPGQRFIWDDRTFEPMNERIDVEILEDEETFNA